MKRSEAARRSLSHPADGPPNLTPMPQFPAIAAV
jgi:hypothetical protein